MRKIFLLLCFLLLASPSWAATYYVSVADGLDTNTGLSSAAGAPGGPWQTIAKVNASAFAAGDFIYFKKGETWAEQLTVQSSGGAGNVITFGAYGVGANPVITARGSVVGWDGAGNWTSVDTTVTFQDNGGVTTAYNTYDTSLDVNAPDTNVGTTDNSPIRSLPAYNKRALLAFPNIVGTGTSQIPSGTTITSATLLFTLWSGSGNRGIGLDIKAYTVNRDWAPATNETTATWNKYNGTDAWTAPGGDYDAVAVASHTLASNTESPITFNLTTSVQAFLSGTHANYGWIFKFDPDPVNSPFYDVCSKNNGTAASRPTLSVIYSTNVWTKDIAFNPGRVWIDGVEYLKAETAVGVGATSMWYYDSVAGKLYVYSVGNPAVTYASIESAQTTADGYALDIEGKNYITVQNLDVRGGQNAIHIQTSSHLDFGSMAIGLDSLMGIETYSSGVGSVDYVKVHDSTIESGFNFTYNYESPGPSDGILLRRGATQWEIYNNVISNWGHCGINIIQATTQNVIGTIDFHHNEISGLNVSYMRGFATECMPASSSGITIHHNNFHDLTVRSQITSSGVSVYYNIFAKIRETAARAEEDAQALSIESYDESGISYPATNNLIYNNVIYDTDSLGLRLTSANSNNTTGNIIKNNIFMKCGQSSVGYSNKCLYVDNDTFVNTNTISNNVMYISGQTSVINYRGTSYTVSNFQSNLSNSDVAVNNVYVDPLFVSTSDFYLLRGSPCIGAGTNVSLTTDYAGKTVSNPPEIGAYEFFPGYINSSNSYYCDPAGVDATADGSLGNPFATLSHACTHVTTSGDVIHLKAGNYTDNTQAVLAIGVHVEGVTAATTTITSNVSNYLSMVTAFTTGCVLGSNDISNLGFINTTAAQYSISSTGRTDQTIHNCTFATTLGIYISGKPGQARVTGSFSTTGTAIPATAKASPTVFTVAGHGMSSGDTVRFDSIAQAGWTALNNNIYAITWVDVDHFSIAVDSTGYALNYDAGDPGLYCQSCCHRDDKIQYSNPPLSTDWATNCHIYNCTFTNARVKWHVMKTSSISNCTFNNSVNTGAINLQWTSADKKVTRGSGSFINDGFVVGGTTVSDAANANNSAGNTITVVTALQITFSGALTDEGPVAKTLYQYMPAVGNTSYWFDQCDVNDNIFNIGQVKQSSPVICALEMWHVNDDSRFFNNTADSWFSIGGNSETVTGGHTWSYEGFKNSIYGTVYRAARVNAWEIMTTPGNVYLHDNYIGGDAFSSCIGIHTSSDHSAAMTNIKIARNVLYDPSLFGIYIQPQYALDDFDNFYIYNNVIEAPLTCISADAANVGGTDIDNLYVYNNLLLHTSGAPNRGIALTDAKGVPTLTATADYNYSHGVTTPLYAQAGCVLTDGGHNVDLGATEPGILAAGARPYPYYQLTGPASNLYNVGTTAVGITLSGTDYNGPLPEVGAYEINSGPPRGIGGN